MTVQKKDRYTEAFARIESSISSEHYFEAITIEESIISDRIVSFLDSMDLVKVDELHRQSFASLITLWKFAVLTPSAIWEPCEGLIKEVDEWRKRRIKRSWIGEISQSEGKYPNNEGIPSGCEECSSEG
jgi:hypothetical protein